MPVLVLLFGSEMFGYLLFVYKIFPFPGVAI